MGTPIAPSTESTSTDITAPQPTKTKAKKAKAATSAEQNPAAAEPTTPEPKPHVHSCQCGWTQSGRPTKAGKTKVGWTDAERQELAKVIAEHGPYQGYKQYAAAHPERTALGCQYQWTNKIKGKMEAIKVHTA